MSVAPSTPPPLIELRRLTKTYGKGDAAFQALRGINLTIHKGEFVASWAPVVPGNRRS